MDKKFSVYSLLDEKTAEAYVREKFPAFKESGRLVSAEIGDGNLNYVFRVVDEEKKQSVIIKQAGDLSRLSKVPYSRDRARIEAMALKEQGRHAKGVVPELYFYDEIMNVTAMEDLTGHVIMRSALNKGEMFPRFAGDITDFMANVLVSTSDIVMDHKQKKSEVVKFTNGELCSITEKLVYTEPFNDNANRNKLFAPNADWLKQQLYEDDELALAAARAKFKFMEKAQCLLHGDLHTGSIFVTSESTKVIDPEFAFYGPMGFDPGMLMANIIFAFARGLFDFGGTGDKDEYTQWLLKTAVEIIDMFKEKFLLAVREKATDPMAKTAHFAERYLEDVMVDAAEVCGLELIRRVVGVAGVSDINTIGSEERRISAERFCIGAGKHLLKHPTEFKAGEDYRKLLLSAQAI